MKHCLLLVLFATTPLFAQFANYEAFRLFHGLLPGTDAEDPDRDGCANLTEYYFGTNPLRPDCGNPLEIDFDPVNVEANLSFVKADVSDVIPQVQAWRNGSWVNVNPLTFAPLLRGNFADPMIQRDTSLLRLQLVRPNPPWETGVTGDSGRVPQTMRPGTSLFLDEQVPALQPNPFNGKQILPPYRNPANNPNNPPPGQPPVVIHTNSKVCVFVAFEFAAPSWVDDTWTFVNMPVAGNESGPFYELVFVKEFGPGEIVLPAIESPSAPPYLVFLEEKPFTQPEEIVIEDPGCPVEVTVESIPPYDLDMEISGEWEDAATRASLIQEVEADLQAVVDQSDAAADLDEFVTRYGPSQNPTSASAFWAVNHIGGFASAYANARLYTDNNQSVGIWNTEEMTVQAGGERIIEMVYSPESPCTAVVAGATLARVKASTTVFDAVDGGGGQLEFLQGANYAGTLAMQYLISRGRGSSKKFGEFVRDEVQEDMQDAFTEEVFNTVKDNVGEQLQELIDDMELGIEVADIELDDFSIPSLEEIVEEYTGIDIPDIGDLEIRHLAWNLVSGTYATSSGFYVATVGDNQGTAHAQSVARYLRQGLESREEAVSESGTACEAIIVTDAKPNGLRATIVGQSDMACQAKGNGHAMGYLESMQITILVGICFCPDGYSYEIVMDAGWYTTDKEAISDTSFDSLQTDVEDDFADALDAGLINSGSSTEDIAAFLNDSVEQWAGNHPFEFGSCPF